MYCPKCNQSFDEGSRRFCPSDGSRLISELNSVAGKTQEGIFASLIPQMSGINDLGTKLEDFPGVFVGDEEFNDEQVRTSGSESDEVFFEMVDPEESGPRDFIEMGTRPDLPPKPETTSSPISPVQVWRKIDPATIPEGHVDLANGYDAPDVFSDLDLAEPEKLVGQRVKGRYKVTEFLGGNETGITYLADDQIVAGKKVIVRVHTRNDDDEMMKSNLAEERISLSHFSHPNVARFIDSGEFSDRSYFIISEYIDGLSLRDLLSIHGQFDIRRASRLIRQIASGLSEAHQAGILHRDIRPENIAIDPDAGDVEQAKLLSFGASNGDPHPDNLVYKSPEVIDGRINTIVSDIYSLAVVGYEMLTGHLPFEGTTKNEILRSQYAGPAAWPADLRPELSPAINEIFQKALSFKPAERYTKAREFGDALSAALTERSAVSDVHDTAQSNFVDLQPLAPPSDPEKLGDHKPSTRIQIPSPKRSDPLSKKSNEISEGRGPTSTKERSSKVWYIIGAVLLALAASIALGWYYVTNNPGPTASTSDISPNSQLSTNTPESSNVAEETRGAPLPRSLAQPPNTEVFQNKRADLKGDLATNFVGFSLFYPKDWKIIGPEPGASEGARGKFLDISRLTADDRLMEQMLVSYYPSDGTFTADAGKFPQLVRETNETLEKILPGYQMVSEGEITFNGNWRAYEVKFQGGGTSADGEKLIVWGRRLFVPAARPGATSGFEITMLATSYAKDIKGVDEVGVRGELGPILNSFEPNQSY